MNLGHLFGDPSPDHLPIDRPRQLRMAWEAAREGLPGWFPTPCKHGEGQLRSRCSLRPPTLCLHGARSPFYFVSYKVVPAISPIHTFVRASHHPLGSSRSFGSSPSSMPGLQHSMSVHLDRGLNACGRCHPSAQRLEATNAPGT